MIQTRVRGGRVHFHISSVTTFPITHKAESSSVRPCLNTNLMPVHQEEDWCLCKPLSSYWCWIRHVYPPDLPLYNVDGYVSHILHYTPAEGQNRQINGLGFLVSNNWNISIVGGKWNSPRQWIYGECCII